MYICIYIYIYVCVHIHTYIHTYILYIHIYECICVYMRKGEERQGREGRKESFSKYTPLFQSVHHDANR
jgi:hypothetical protein